MSESANQRVSGTRGSGGGETGDYGECGGGREKDKEARSGVEAGFVFERHDGRKGQEGGGSSSETLHQRRWDNPSLYRDKLLSPGAAGFLVQHDEEEDIVRGWKAYFNKMNNVEKGQEDSESEEVEEGTNAVKKPTLTVTEEEYTNWCRPWMNSLIIKVLGAEIPMYIIRDRIHRMWKPQAPIKTIPLSNGYCIVSFTKKEDRDYAYQEGPWMIEDHYLIVQRWRPNFNPWKADCQRRIAAWVRLPDLPMEFYSVESL